MFSQSEKDLSCTICQNIFNDPVVLLCSHSFCKVCLQRWWREKKIQQCPLCKEVTVMSDPPRNLALKNLCENLSMGKDLSSLGGPEEPLCGLHNERLKLFCLDHEEPVCVVCQASKMHKNHSFSPADEAAEDRRKELQETMQPLRDKLKIIKEVRRNCDETATHIKIQARNTERKIKVVFKKLHEFLEEAEEARMCSLRDEEEQKSRVMKEKIEGLDREIEALSETIRVTERQMRAEDVGFLQNYKAALERVQQRPLPEDPEQVSGALIDEAKHLGNLSFNIWNKMKKMVSYSPVILDPNSASPELVLSEDLTAVSHRPGQKLPHNPERFENHPYVVSSEGFDSGIHCWEVEVINNKFWGVGVVKKSVSKKVKILSDCLEFAYCDGKYMAYSPPRTNKILSVKTKPTKIRVHLDFNRGKLSFFDSDTNTLLHTFTRTFTERLFPYFGTMNELPMKISPVTVSVQVEQLGITPFSGLWSSVFML